MAENFNCPIKVTLNSFNEDNENNEAIIVGYANYGYDIVLIDELNNIVYMDELIKPHKRYIIDKIKCGNI